MRHLNEGVLRRVHDDSFAVSNDERRHLDTCARCRRRMDAVAGDAAAAARLLARPLGAAAAPDDALARLRSRVAVASNDGAPRRAPRAPSMARRRWAVGLVVAPVMAVAVVGTASAEGWLSIFAPTRVAPITLTAGELNGLPDLSGFGRMRASNPETHRVGGARQAAAATGLHVLQPGALPAGIPSTVTWAVVGHGNATFTLDRAAAAAAAARAGRVAPTIPSGLDGTTVTVQAGPAVLAIYGKPAQEGSTMSLPTLAIAEGRRPTASTNGASLKQLEDFLVAQPGVSPQLAAEIRAIGSAGSTLPIPIVSGTMTSQTVSIDGVQGVAAGDSTGLGAAVVWEKDGVVYAVGGLLPQSEVLDIARSLH